MLTFESPFYEISGVIVFRDHASKTTFHYLAGPPHLTKNPDGSVNLLLLKYKEAIDALGGANPVMRDELGGAFLMFGVDCGLTETVKGDVIRELESKVPPGSGGVNLVPVLYTKGTVNVIALDKQTAVAAEPDDGGQKSKFIRGILGTATPSLLQDQRAIFSLALTPDAATLIEEAYETGLSPIGVMYELEFTGLRPALAVRAKVDMKRAYEQFKLAANLGVNVGGGQPTGGQAGGQTGGQAGGQTGGQTGGQAGGQAGGQRTGTGQVTGQPVTGQGAGQPVTGQPVTGQGAGQPVTGQPMTGQGAGQPVTGQPVTGQPVTGQPGTGQGQPTTGQPTTGQPTTGQATTGQPTTGQTQPSSVQVGVDIGISYAIEQLKESRAIEIEIIRQQTGQSVEQMEQNALALLKETLLNDFFKPAMSDVSAATQAVSSANQMIAGTAATSQGVANAAGAKNANTGGTRVQLGLQLQWKKEEELKEATFDYSVTAPETRTHAPNGFFSALLTGTELAQHIRSIKLDDDFFRFIDVPISTTADFDRLDIAAITVDLQYGGTVDQPAVTATAVLRKGDTGIQRFRTFIDRDEASYRYRITYDFGQSAEIAAQRQSAVTPWRATTSRALVIHPPEDIALLEVRVEPGVVDWDVIKQIETTLAYDDPAHAFHTERSYLLTSGTAAQDWIVRLTDPAVNTYSVRNIWHLTDNREIDGVPTAEKRPQLPVADPFVDRLPIRIQPLVDPTNVARVDVELVYSDPRHAFEVRKNVGINGPEFAAVTETIPVIDPSVREYTYQATLIKKNSSAELQPETTTDSLSILVTEGGAYFDVTITILGDMTAAGLQAIQVDLRAQPLDGAVQKVESRLFQPGVGAAQTVVRLLLRVDKAQQFEFRTIAFTADRGPVETAWTPHANANLVVQPTRLLVG